MDLKEKVQATRLTRRAAVTGLAALSACGGGGEELPGDAAAASPITPAASPSTVVSSALPALPKDYKHTKIWDFRSAKAGASVKAWPEWDLIGRNIGSDFPPASATGVNSQVAFRDGALQLGSEPWGKPGICPNSKGQMIDWISGGVETQARWTQERGFFESRFRWDVMPGARPAFWMMHSDPAKESWPVCGEIDIMEYFGLYTGKYQSTIHKASYGTSGPNITNNTVNVVKSEWAGHEFHNYGVAWEADKFVAYLDGQPVNTIAPGVRGDSYPFNRPFFLMLTMIVQFDKGLDGVVPAGKRPLMEVEWVRAARI